MLESPRQEACERDVADAPCRKRSRVEKPCIAIISTGGTIASTGADTLDISDYQGPLLDGEQLVQRVPELAKFSDVVVVTYASIGSDRVCPSDWLALHSKITECNASASPTGIVVTHGTATLEETAYFLHLTLKVEIPVVVVGSQRPITGLSSDAQMNLVNAVRVAASPLSRGRGVLTILNDEIHSAREVTKSSVFRLDAFQAPGLGPLGHADPDQVVLYRAPVRKHYPSTDFDVSAIGQLPRVDIIESYAGADGACVAACVHAGAKGLVIASLAPGTVPPQQAEALVQAQKQSVLVVFSTRAGGRIVSLPSQQPEGIVTADNLTPQKARVLLMLALTRWDDAQSVQRVFDSY